jgi:hypothetical protein
MGYMVLCTQSGLEDIAAAKRLAILEINEWLEEGDLTQAQISQLRLAVNLLDSTGYCCP